MKSPSTRRPKPEPDECLCDSPWLNTLWAMAMLYSILWTMPPWPLEVLMARATRGGFFHILSLLVPPFLGPLFTPAIVMRHVFSDLLPYQQTVLPFLWRQNLYSPWLLLPLIAHWLFSSRLLGSAQVFILATAWMVHMVLIEEAIAVARRRQRIARRGKRRAKSIRQKAVTSQPTQLAPASEKSNQVNTIPIMEIPGGGCRFGSFLDPRIQAQAQAQTPAPVRPHLRVAGKRHQQKIGRFCQLLNTAEAQQLAPAQQQTAFNRLSISYGFKNLVETFVDSCFDFQLFVHMSLRELYGSNSSQATQTLRYMIVCPPGGGSIATVQVEDLVFSYCRSNKLQRKIVNSGIRQWSPAEEKILRAFRLPLMNMSVNVKTAKNHPSAEVLSVQTS